MKFLFGQSGHFGQNKFYNCALWLHLRTLGPRNTGSRSILRTQDPGNTRSQAISGTQEPGNTGSQSFQER